MALRKIGIRCRSSRASWEERAIYLIYGENISGALVRTIVSFTARRHAAVRRDWLHVAAGEPAFCEHILGPAGQPCIPDHVVHRRYALPYLE